MPMCHSRRTGLLPVLFASLLCMAHSALVGTNITANAYIDESDGTSVAFATELLTDGQAGANYPFNLVMTDTVTNDTIGVATGNCLCVQTHALTQCQYTFALREGALQVSGPFALPGAPSYEGQDFYTQSNGEIGQLGAVNWAITGGTGLYNGAFGYFEMTIPPPSPTGQLYGPGVVVNGVLLSFSYYTPDPQAA